MPLPQVNDRLKEIPAQALRTLFASIGQLLLVETCSGRGPPSNSPAVASPRPPGPLIRRRPRRRR